MLGFMREQKEKTKGESQRVRGSEKRESQRVRNEREEGKGK